MAASSPETVAEPPEEEPDKDEPDDEESDDEAGGLLGFLGFLLFLRSLGDDVGRRLGAGRGQDGGDGDVAVDGLLVGFGHLGAGDAFLYDLLGTFSASGSSRSSVSKGISVVVEDLPRTTRATRTVVSPPLFSRVTRSMGLALTPAFSRIALVPSSAEATRRWWSRRRRRGRSHRPPPSRHFGADEGAVGRH